MNSHSPGTAHYGCPNDFGKLREVAVGIIDGLTLPPYGPDLAHYNDELKQVLSNTNGQPVSIADAMPERFARAAEQLENIARHFQDYGVTVHRPRALTQCERGYLENLQPGWNQLYVADPVFMLGTHFLELNIRRAYRRKEIFPLRDLIAPLFGQDPAIHTAAIHQAAPFSPSGAGPGPYLEGGDFLVVSPSDVVVGINGALCSNIAGVEWLERYLQPYGMRVHRVLVEGRILHGLGVMALIREGLMLAYKDSLPDGLPHILKDWEVIELTHQEALQYATIGVSLDPNTYMIDHTNTRVMELLNRRGVTPVPIDASDVGFFGGSIRCVTLPLARDLA